jgi:hypothetical protein
MKRLKDKIHGVVRPGTVGFIPEYDGFKGEINSISRARRRLPSVPRRVVTATNRAAAIRARGTLGYGEQCDYAMLRVRSP